MKPKDRDLRTEEIRSALLAIGAAHDGILPPQAIVDAARNSRHVLHDEFLWDDEEAGEAYRLAQAGALVRRVKIEVIKQEENSRHVKVTTTRGFQSRPSQRSQKGGYEAVQDIMRDPGKREELLAQVIKELGAYRKRYAQLSALADVWAAVDSLIDAQPKRATDDSRNQPSA